MTDVTVRPIRADLAFGARVGGVTLDQLADRRSRAPSSTTAFEEHGLLVFEDVEPTPQMQVAISTVFGPLKDHPSQATPRAGDDCSASSRSATSRTRAAWSRLDGRLLSQWLPWHFDHCYNDELNRAGVLRPVEMPARRWA